MNTNYKRIASSTADTSASGSSSAQETSNHLTAIPENPIDAIVPGGATTLFAVFAVTVCLGLYWLIDRHQRAQQENALLRTATEAVSSLTQFRSFYSEEIVSRLTDSEVLITHEFKDHPNAIPLPATMSIEFGRFLEGKGEATSFRLLSDMPFPARANRDLDDFEKDAIAFLKARPDKSYHRVEPVNGSDHLRFAKGVVMDTSCVACHNNHPQSPFREWKVGDLRGIQEVILPLSVDASSISGMEKTFREVVIFVICSFSIALFFILLLSRRNRLAFKNLEKLASVERHRVIEIRKSKELIEEGLARLSAVVDNVAEAIITIGEDGIIETANPATEKVFGYRRQELIGQNVAQLMTDADSGRHDGYMQQYYDSGEARIIGIGREVTGRHKNGNPIPLELSISEVLLEDRRIFTGIVRDISERKIAENALRQSEEQARKLSLVAARTDNAVVITDADGKIEWVNEGFIRITGYDSEEAVGRRPSDLLQREDVDQEAIVRIHNAVVEGRGFHEVLANYNKAGELYWISIDAQPILDEQGGVQQYIAIQRDISDRILRERDLEEARTRAEEASRAKSRFLAMMSHEVRTPLNGVIGALGLLRETKLDVEQLRYTDTSRSSAESLLAIINDILDYSKMEADKLDLESTTFDVRELVDSVNDIFMVRCNEKGIDLAFDVDPAVPISLCGDPARTRQILVNLVGNAVKFTEQGEIRLTTVVHSSRQNDVVLEFGVRDTGVGISQSNQLKLFEEFWTGTPGGVGMSPGTGLGLAISKQLVTMMGGEIGLESAVGVGSRFWFRIPFVRVEDSSDGIKLTDHNDSQSNSEKQLAGRVLLVEDNPANQMIAKAMLQKLGLSVDVVGNGIEAIEAIQSRPYDLVLMDIAMPEMDGLEATLRIRELEGTRMRTPIIAMTAHAMRGDREKFIEGGLDDYLVKPVRRAQLRNCLMQWLEESTDPAEIEPMEHTLLLQVLDEEILAQLADDVGREILPELVETFLKELDNRLVQIEAAFQATDMYELTAQAHPLKSSAANFGAVALSGNTRSIEIAARAGDAEALSIAVEQIQTLAQETRTALIAAMEKWG